MKTSLKTYLLNTIKETGYLSINELDVIVRELGYKLSNAERRLRELMDDGLVEKKEERGHIIAYLVKKDDKATICQETPPIVPTGLVGAKNGVQEGMFKTNKLYYGL